MKKFLIGILTATLLFALAVGVVGCKPQAESEFQAFTDGFNRMTQAKEIRQEIEVKNGSLLVYSLEKTYEKGNDAYSVSGEEKKLNEVGASEAYTVTTIEETVQKADTFTTSMRLSEELFSAFEIAEGKLTASVKDESVNAVFGLNGDHAPMHNVQLTLTLNDGRISALETVFTSGTYDVQILLTFSY